MSVMTYTWNNVPGHVLAKNVCDTLRKHYPGHWWKVNVEEKQGVVYIFHMILSPIYGYVVHIKDIGPDHKVIVRAGGHVLEAFGMSRGKASREAVRNMPRDFTGRRAFDKGALVNGS